MLTMTIHRYAGALTVTVCAMLLTACSHTPPANLARPGEYYMPEREDPAERDAVYRQVLADDVRFYRVGQPYGRYLRDAARREREPTRATSTGVAPDAPAAGEPAAGEPAAVELPLSRGDRVRVRIVDGDEFNGDYEVDMDGTLQLPDLPLAAGDRIRVESTGVFQPGLVRPSQITPPGIRIFLSNLLMANAYSRRQRQRIKAMTTALPSVISYVAPPPPCVAAGGQPPSEA